MWKIQVKQNKFLISHKHKLQDIYHEKPHKYKSIINVAQCETRNRYKYIIVSPHTIDNSTKQNTSRVRKYKYKMKHLDII